MDKSDTDTQNDTATDSAASILQEADETISGRDDTHGDPVENHEQIADLWSAFLGTDISAREVSEMMILVKLSRAQNGSPARDHYVDIGGYAKIADLCRGGQTETDAVRTDGSGETVPETPREMLEQQVRRRDDGGDGAPIGDVVEATVDVFSTHETLGELKRMVKNGDVYGPTDTTLRLLDNGGDA